MDINNLPKDQEILSVPSTPDHPKIDAIDVMSLNANQITSGTIDASVINVTNISASEINSGTLTGITITGGAIQTATSGQRVVLASDNSISFYDSNNILEGQIYGYTTALSIENAPGRDINIGNRDSLSLGNVHIYATQTTIDGTINSTLLPTTDNLYDLGSNTKRWKLVRGVTITPGDLAWEETMCHICNRHFALGDKLTMIVKKMSFETGDLLTYTVPICKSCFLAD